MHNGFIAGSDVLRRELMLAVAPELFANIHGSTDTEVVFHLALTFGLEDGALRDGWPRALAVRVGRRGVRTAPPSRQPRFQRLTPDDRLIVSEPFSHLPGVWQEIPEATAVTVRRGGVLEERPFRPRAGVSGPGP